jgi:hypothetical protein
MSWFDALDASRTFSIAFGTVTSGLCLLIAVPMLWWMLPRHRRAVFDADVDPHGYLQIACGVAAMAMAWANALCRYIPHGPLGAVHPAFFITTLVLLLALGPTVYRAARAAQAGRSHAPVRGFAANVPALVLVVSAGMTLSIVAVVRAFAPDLGA